MLCIFSGNNCDCASSVVIINIFIVLVSTVSHLDPKHIMNSGYHDPQQCLLIACKCACVYVI
jgi:hypothetical protein